MQNFRNDIQIKIRPVTPAKSPRGGGVGRAGPEGDHPPDKQEKFKKR